MAPATLPVPLTRFDVDTLEDRPVFVRQLHLGDQHAAIIRAVIQMAHSLIWPPSPKAWKTPKWWLSQRTRLRPGAGLFLQQALPAEDFARFVRQYRAVL